MNHIYRLVWNAVRQLWQCASENTRTKGKTSTVKAVINTQFTPPPLLYPYKFVFNVFVVAILGTISFPTWAENFACQKEITTAGIYTVSERCDYGDHFLDGGAYY
ncbi:ESPR domain-containing protein [Avibacterium paragallinarum]|uniref:ESPR domain-containing protein n=1 Tax=Avibacterium paragallinarum TaxID=728 RepID=UPI00397C8312